ncbi:MULTISPECIES: FecR family protein [Pseudomonas syringae group]|uniref:FecR domain-containing protein n=4 Tax=Pseudomonas syringae group TaxID=136849 RepID=A0AAW4E247_PSESX|nr:MULTISPECIES: FecR domain-containing protein [Pseudomonas syringae group]KGK95476.1 glycerol-3-phosphate ABC transporter substrate-binding protein [Pseudomonas syringae pv. tomato]KKI28084.1 glycerol-3-phosphate ABC transporter substrate-binding protein [Pseudomonas syringae pv. persicae]KPW33728.1 Regulatory protein [Pseudomonas syringae pv. apii]KPY91913.1 Regulatory protein [Pseudomonas syringae pv. tomato]KTC05390.1 glycerol-3-phosphate ABC transporter substrate-binding protein [Pseudom
MSPKNERPRAIAREVLSDRAMDQALSWLIELEGADDVQLARFQEWLNADPEHARAYHKACAAWNSQPVRQAAAVIAQPLTPTSRRHIRTYWKPLATAAVLLLGIFSFSNLPLRLQADHLTVVGERQRLQLADGSKVLLNTNSAFSSKIDEQQRSARLLQGEAFFDVAPRTGLPLEIEAGPVRMSANSTEFSVRYLDGVAQVQVQRGAVDVRATRGGSSVSLGAGDSVRVGPGGFGHRERLDPARDLAWVQGRLVFDNCPLSEVLAELRRYYPGWIISTNAQLDRVAVTGNYRLDNPLDVVRSLAQITSASLHEMPALLILN